MCDMQRGCRAVIALAIAIASTIAAGCDDDDGDDSGALVQYRIEAGELDFPPDDGEREPAILPVSDRLLSVDRDGRATYQIADQPPIEFRLSDADAAKLESEVDAIDFNEADEQLSGETEEGLPRLSLTHDGTTVRLGDEFFDINSGEGPEVADQIGDLLGRLEAIGARAPGAEATAEQEVATAVTAWNEATASGDGEAACALMTDRAGEAMTDPYDDIGIGPDRPPIADTCEEAVAAIAERQGETDPADVPDVLPRDVRVSGDKAVAQPHGGFCWYLKRSQDEWLIVTLPLPAPDDPNVSGEAPRCELG